MNKIHDPKQVLILCLPERGIFLSISPPQKSHLSLNLSKFLIYRYHYFPYRAAFQMLICS
jgi:hypothetical protein